MNEVSNEIFHLLLDMGKFEGRDEIDIFDNWSIGGICLQLTIRSPGGTTTIHVATAIHCHFLLVLLSYLRSTNALIISSFAYTLFSI